MATLSTFPPVHSSAVRTSDTVWFGMAKRRSLYQALFPHIYSSIMGRSPAKNLMSSSFSPFTDNALKHFWVTALIWPHFRLNAPEACLEASPSPNKILWILCATFCGATQNACAHCFLDGTVNVISFPPKQTDYLKVPKKSARNTKKKPKF